MWEWEEWSLCNVHLALAEPPHFQAAESQPDVDRAFIYVLGYESLDDLMGHWDAMREGGSRPVPAATAASRASTTPSRHPPAGRPACCRRWRPSSSQTAAASSG